MSKQNLLKFSLLSTLMASQTLYAVPTIEELSAGRKEVAIRYANLDNANVYHGRFRAIREQYINGKSGLVQSTDQFNQASAKWMDAWRALIQVRGLVEDPKNVNPIVLSEAIKLRMQNQRIAFESIKSLGDRIIAQQREASAQLEGISGVVANNFPTNYRAVVSALLTQLQATKSQLVVIGPKVSQRMNELENVYEPTRRALITALNNALIAAGRTAISESINRAQAVIDADRLVEPLIVNARASYTKFRMFRARNLIFAARQQSSLIEAMEEQARQSIGAANLPKIYTDEAMRYISSYSKRSREELALLEADGPVKSLQAASLKLRKVFTTRCQNADATVKCNLLQTVGRISNDQIAAMSTDQLNFYEQTWLKVGPLTAETTNSGVSEQ